ncbi:sulfite exporter TauE/SafE family protein [Paenibacillus sp. KN14-4R]|uniref:sulfite exporter TauE/SafE family protein n=1 Tax=Paenibacillus sp. KN14-4R TaxID=3445773 RepID=UPI003F9FF38C
MEIPGLDMILFLIVIGFLAAFVDSVVGGGGLITVPALLFTGLSPNMVLGTNKLGGTLSSLTSSASFLSSGKINIRLVAWLFPLSFLGSVGGAYVIHLIPSGFLKPLVITLLVIVTIYTLFKKNWGAQTTYKAMTIGKAILLIIIASVIGFYDGFFGPGTGSFLLFVFLWYGFDFIGASANSKVLNLGSNLGSLITFILMGSVNFYYGIPLGLSMIVGALVGSRFAIRKGAAYVKPLFIGVTALLIGKQLWDVFH